MPIFEHFKIVKKVAILVHFWLKSGNFGVVKRVLQSFKMAWNYLPQCWHELISLERCHSHNSGGKSGFFLGRNRAISWKKFGKPWANLCLSLKCSFVYQCNCHLWSGLGPWGPHPWYTWHIFCLFGCSVSKKLKFWIALVRATYNLHRICPAGNKKLSHALIKQ